MRKTFVVVLLVLLYFSIEFFLFDIFGRWLTPDLLLLLVIFLNLYLGIRHSIVAAILAGILKDSFSIGVFGINTFSFIVCAYMTTFLQKNIYHSGSPMSKILLVFLIVTTNIIVQIILRMMFANVDIFEVLKFVFIPKTLTTLFVSTFIFRFLKICASKLFV